MYDIVRDIAERKGSMASIVRTREMMRLEFYQSLFLTRQKELNECTGDEKKKGKRNRWTMKGMWKRLVGGRDGRQVDRESNIVLGGGRIGISRLQGQVFRD